MRFIQTGKGKTLEAIIYPLLVLIVMWSVFLIDRVYHLNLSTYGVKPGTVEGLKGILFMPFLHGQTDFSHIINNSIPTFILLSTLIYFYREIALYVILFLWIGGGFLLWYIAENDGSYHIGMSGVIYGLFGFILISGFIRKYLPLQAIALFVAFAYGSLVWGLLPTKSGISWEGHLAGILVGVTTAIAFRKKGPKPPKYQYEIEQEMGIEPPDYEEEYNEKRRIIIERQKAKEEEKQKLDSRDKSSVHKKDTSQKTTSVNYRIVPKKKKDE